MLLLKNLRCFPSAAQAAPEVRHHGSEAILSVDVFLDKQNTDAWRSRSDCGFHPDGSAAEIAKKVS